MRLLGAADGWRWRVSDPSDPVGDSYRTRMVKDWEPGGTIDQLRIEIDALRSRVADLEADIASRSGTWTRCRCGGTFRAPKQVGMSVPEHTCPGCRRAEVAEDRVEKLEAVERAARAATAHLEARAWDSYRTNSDGYPVSDERLCGTCGAFAQDGWRHESDCAFESDRRVLDAALAAVEVRNG